MATRTAFTSYDTPPATCTPSITSPPTILSPPPLPPSMHAPVRNTVSGDENPGATLLSPQAPAQPMWPLLDSSSSATTAKKKSQNLFLFCWQAVCHPLCLLPPFNASSHSPSPLPSPVMSYFSFTNFCTLSFLSGPK